MAKDDFGDKMGKAYDPLGVYDMDGDGEYNIGEALDAEYEYYRTTEEPEHPSRFVSDLGDDIDDDDYIDSDDEFEAEDDGGDIGKDDGATFYTTVTFSVGSEDDENLTPEEERLRAARKYLEKVSHRSNLDESEVLEKKRARFMLENNCLAAKYCDIYCGFDFNEAIFHELKLPKEYLDNYDIDDNLYVNLGNIKSYSVWSACAILKWIYKEFYPYKELDRKEFGKLASSVLSMTEDEDIKIDTNKKNVDEVVEEIRKLCC